MPGGLLISECAAAAYETVDSSFALDNVQAQFLSATKPDQPISYTVTRLSTGKRFAVRLVTASQQHNQKTVLSATLAFASHPAADNHPAMTHTVHRETPHSIPAITLDDLEPALCPLGPFMKFQRLPVHTPPTSDSFDPTSNMSRITTTACHISPSLPHPSTHKIHTLALLNLSDYHVLDAPLILSDLTFGLPAINDTTKIPTPSQVKMFTSLNHSVYFHKNHGGFRADEMCYAEAKCSWAGEGRALVLTRIFSKDGGLIASCVQEVSLVDPLTTCLYCSS